MDETRTPRDPAPQTNDPAPEVVPGVVPVVVPGEVVPDPDVPDVDPDKLGDAADRAKLGRDHPGRK